MSMKMTPQERQSIETAASWQSHQQYDRRTVLMLLSHIRALEWEIESVLKAGEDIVNSRLQSLDEALSEIGKHARTILMLQREKTRLEEEVDAARESRKVTVPREVAEAIERLKRTHLSNYGIIALSDQIPMLFRDYDEAVIADLKIIKSFPFSDILLGALLNGYVVEQTPDDYVLEHYLDFLANGQHAAADAIEMVLGYLGGKNELLQKMHAVERPLPF